MSPSALIWHPLFATNSNHRALEAAVQAGLVPDPNVVVDGLPLLHAFLRAQAYMKLDEPKRGFINVWGSNDVSSKDAQPRELEEKPDLDQSAFGVVKALLAAGANPFVVTAADPKWGQDALDAAVALGQSSIVSLMLDHPLCPPLETLVTRTGPNASRRDPWLHALAAKGQAAVMEVLLEKGWAVDTLNKKGSSALFEVRNLDTLQTLLTHGASPDMVNQEGLGVVEAWGSRPQAYSFWTMAPKNLAEHLLQFTDSPALRQQAILKDVFSSTADVLDQSKEFERLTERLNTAGFDASTWRVNGVGKFSGSWTPVAFHAIQTLMGRVRGFLPWKVLLSHPHGCHLEHEVIPGVPEKHLLWLGLWKVIGRDFDHTPGQTYGVSSQEAKQKFHQDLCKSGLTTFDPSDEALQACSRLIEVVKASSTQVEAVLGPLGNWLTWKQKFESPSDLLEGLWKVRSHGLQGIHSHTWWELVEKAYSPNADAHHQAMWVALAILSPSQPSKVSVKELLAARMEEPVDWAHVEKLVDSGLKEEFKQGLQKFQPWGRVHRAYLLEQAYEAPAARAPRTRF